MAELKTSFRIEMIDRFSARAAKIAGAAGRLGKVVEGAQRELAVLGKRDQSIRRMRELATALGKTRAESLKAGKAATDLGRKIAAAAKPPKKLQQAFASARRESKRLQAAEREQAVELQRLRSGLEAAGVSTRHLELAQRRVGREIEAVTRKMRNLDKVQQRTARSRAVLGKRMAGATQTALIAGQASRVVGSAMRAATAPLDRLRDFESARGEVATLFADSTGAVDRESVDTIAAAARARSRQTVGLESADYMRAAYLTKSGISGLDAQGVADMTDLAALTARATVADTIEIADLFKSGFTRFKESLYSDLTTREFGTVFSAQLAQAVQQFATDGSKMAQAMTSAGNDMTLAGVGLSDQMTVLGMLQGTEAAGTAGTAMLALSNAAAKAQERFAEAGVDIRLLDEENNLRALPDLLDELQGAYGDEIDQREKMQIQEALGREEAVRFFSALWGRGEEFRAAAAKQQAAAERALNGANIAAGMAQARDDNTSARMELLRKRWDDLLLMVGERATPVMEWLTAKMEILIGAVERVISWLPGWASTAAIGGATLVAALTAAAFGIGLAWQAMRVAFAGLAHAANTLSVRLHAAAGGGGVLAPGGKGGTAKARRVRGALDKIKGRGGAAGRIGKALSGFGGGGVGRLAGGLSRGSLLGLGIGAATTLPTLFSDETSGAEKGRSAGSLLGGIALGAGTGALAGTVVPGIGNLAGLAVGAAGGAIGYWLGGEIGESIAGAIDGGEAAKAAAGALPLGAAAGGLLALPGAAAGGAPSAFGLGRPLSIGSARNVGGVHLHGPLVIEQHPGENAMTLAERIMQEIEERQDEDTRGAYYD